MSKVRVVMAELEGSDQAVLEAIRTVTGVPSLGSLGGGSDRAGARSGLRAAGAGGSAS